MISDAIYPHMSHSDGHGWPQKDIFPTIGVGCQRDTLLLNACLHAIVTNSWIKGGKIVCIRKTWSILKLDRPLHMSCLHTIVTNPKIKGGRFTQKGQIKSILIDKGWKRRYTSLSFLGLYYTKLNLTRKFYCQL